MMAYASVKVAAQGLVESAGLGRSHMETNVTFLKKLLDRKRFRYQYKGDNFAVKNRNLSFFDETKFADAYEWSANYQFEGKTSPWVAMDLRWRAHICAWAAFQAKHLEGDFVECGVDTAVLSGAVVRFLDFQNLDRQFYLFDTYAGIPAVSGMTDEEKDIREFMNDRFYTDSYGFVADKMKSFKNVQLVKGLLPETLEILGDRKISYLCVDLNNAPSEKSVMERLWDNLVPGAITVIDDYAHKGHETQYEMWNAFAARHDLMIAALPTGQGLLIKGKRS